jgi:hypothetical protein
MGDGTTGARANRVLLAAFSSNWRYCFILCRLGLASEHAMMVAWKLNNLHEAAEETFYTWAKVKRSASERK